MLMKRAFYILFVPQVLFHDHFSLQMEGHYILWISTNCFNRKNNLHHLACSVIFQNWYDSIFKARE